MSAPETARGVIADVISEHVVKVAGVHWPIPDDQARMLAAACADALTEQGFAVVKLPDATQPSPALIEAAYIAQDDLSKPPARWLIESCAEIICAYVDGQGHEVVHVIGHAAHAEAGEDRG